MHTATHLTKAEMLRRGAEHALAGKQCVPHECQDIDRELFVAMKTQARPGRWYADMRGAFNRGWQVAYAATAS